jgi:hypothetical protein
MQEVGFSIGSKRINGLRQLVGFSYSRKVNRKVLTVSMPHRNEQFEYLQGQQQVFLERGWPVLHIDTKSWSIPPG